MRVLLMVLMVFMAVASATALSLPINPDIKDGVTVDVDEIESIVFTIKGDVNENDVEFFVRPVVEGHAQFEGYFDEYIKAFTLAPYEERQIVVDIEGVQKGRDLFIEYGALYSAEVDGSFGFREKINSYFFLDVVCSGDCGSESVQSPSDSADSSGGGGAIPPTRTIASADDQSVDEKDPNMDEISPQGTSLTTGVADTNNADAKTNKARPTINSSDSISSNSKGLLVTFLILLIVTLFINFAAIQQVKKIGDDL